MATRFVPTFECDADIKFKEAFIKSQKDNIIIIESPVGLPGRAINNKFLEDVAAGARKPFKCPWKCLITCDFKTAPYCIGDALANALITCDFKTAPYCIGDALANAQQGNLDDGFVFAGSNAYNAEKISSVHEVVAAIVNEYEAAVK
jgi:NAD(P)H-dependent flavin oxidoreductase YrpB (nitropropane dioxygenase family)